jgi:pimeloyl-ACP methyl ester carboxylesterase
VYDALRQSGHQVSVVQHATFSLADDVAMTRRVLGGLDGPAILVGHSYGGVVITEAGNDPKVAGLVYVAAFAPDAGESVESLIQNPPPGAPVAPLLPPKDGFLLLDKARFAASFAADVDAATAAFMADAQVPWGLAAVQAKVSQAAWRSKPSWFAVAAQDRMIPPEAQRAMARRAGSTVVEVKASHVAFLSQPEAVVSVVKAAAGAMAATSR